MNICADAGFLIALYDERDEYHKRAEECFEIYLSKRPNVLIIPWPVLYESISTRMARAKERVERIDAHFKALRIKGQLKLLSDDQFREEAIEQCFSEAKRNVRLYRSLSLVDRVIRLVLSDTNTRIGALATFNARDFHDVCRKFRKDIVPGLRE